MKIEQKKYKPCQAINGFSVIGEHMGFGHDRNLVVSFGSKPPCSEGPGHTCLPAVPFGNGSTVWCHLAMKPPRVILHTNCDLYNLLGNLIIRLKECSFSLRRDRQSKKSMGRSIPPKPSAVDLIWPSGWKT
ncbi:hypothetical protein M5K25_011289 [Dendrobium thyrsiflorum]|uniref:Uncharacterized protein n=1 Tax=Dendrobium thyrsiflorum TaxID=117978 RepID=A0ABD0V9G0_DENTH